MARGRREGVLHVWSGEHIDLLCATPPPMLMTGERAFKPQVLLPHYAHHDGIPIVILEDGVGWVFGGSDWRLAMPTEHRFAVSLSEITFQERFPAAWDALRWAREVQEMVQ